MLLSLLSASMQDMGLVSCWRWSHCSGISRCSTVVEASTVLHSAGCSCASARSRYAVNRSSFVPVTILSMMCAIWESST